MTWGRYWWPIYLIGVALAFGIAELIALLTNYKNTLTDYARYELNLTAHTNIHTLTWWITLAAWGLFVVVMTLHIWGNQLG